MYIYYADYVTRSICYEDMIDMIISCSHLGHKLWNMLKYDNRLDTHFLNKPQRIGSSDRSDVAVLMSANTN